MCLHGEVRIEQTQFCTANPNVRFQGGPGNINSGNATADNVQLKYQPQTATAHIQLQVHGAKLA